MRRSTAISLFSFALILPGSLSAQMPEPRPGPSTPVTVVNTAPIPVAVPGGIAVSGSVNIANTPNVNVANTPSVTVTNSPTVQSVQNGTWNVGVTGAVSLAAGATVAAAPTVPARPFIYHSPDGAPGLDFGTPSAATRLALTTLIFANQSNAPAFISVYSDSCGGTTRIHYLRPLVPPASTLVISFPTPLVIGVIPGDGGFCVHVETPNDGALYPYTLVGYVL